MNFSKWQITSLVLLRVLVGWHFAYEGIVKVFDPHWTAGMYLRDSQGCFRDMFMWIANNDAVLQCVDFINVAGLLLIGISLMIGMFSKWASIGGMVMLAMFYMSHPSYIGVAYMMPMEGNYLWIDKNIIEMAALLVLAVFPSSHVIGIDRFLKKYISKFI